jgi:hypothetical protein
MGIVRTGLTTPVMLLCVKPIQSGALSCEVGKQYELVLDMGSMYVIKGPGEADAVVPKDAFVSAKKEMEKK